MILPYYTKHLNANRHLLPGPCQAEQAAIATNFTARRPPSRLLPELRGLVPLLAPCVFSAGVDVPAPLAEQANIPYVDSEHLADFEDEGRRRVELFAEALLNAVGVVLASVSRQLVAADEGVGDLGAGTHRGCDCFALGTGFELW